jgi:hypothetical protein
VDTVANSLGSFGRLVPALEELKFVDSCIPSIR